MNKHNVARTVRLSPYRRGMGPTFTLVITDDHGWDDAGRINLGYKLTMHEDGRSTVLFEGNDIRAHVVSDSDQAVAAVMGWLTLREGDTDCDLFSADTDAVKAYREAHAEALSGEVAARFGEY